MHNYISIQRIAKFNISEKIVKEKSAKQALESIFWKRVMSIPLVDVNIMPVILANVNGNIHKNRPLHSSIR